MKKFNALNKKTIITGILAFLCALLVAVSFGLLGSNKNIANAQNTATLANDIKIGEITLSDYETRADGKVFNGAALDKLYNLLVGGGATNQTYANVDALVPAGSTVSYGKGSNTTLLPAFKSAKQLYQDNDNKNIVLNFGGDEWTVTFLTRTGEGNSSDHIIATLWLTDVYKENSAVVYTKFGWTTSTNGGDCNSLYPSTMYSTSQARVETLNAGGMLATNATTATSVAQDPSSHWAKFTMPSVNGSLTNYIVQPDNVKYQHYIAYGAQTNSNTKMQNETLSYWSGTDVDFSLGCNYTTSGLNFNSGSSAAHYNDWGADYLWLPAASEIGFIGSWKVPGFWETVSDNASQYTGQTLHNTVTAWLRSGSGNTTNNGNPLWADGHGEGVLSSTLLGVRPALHLDLTAAAQAAALETPKGVTQYDDNGTLKDIVYDYGKTWTLTDFGAGAGWYDFANCITNTQYKYKNSGDTTAFDTANPGVTPTSGLHNAGRYKVEFTSNSIYGWNDPANPSQTTNTASFIITIKQKEIEYEPKLYKGTTAVTSLSYGDTGGVVKANVASVSDTGTLAPDIEIKYAGANGTVYAASTTFPTAAGSYTATITDKNAKTSNYKIKLKTGASNPLSFTIGKKEVTLPTLASATKTYNGTAQDFQIANFDPAVLDISAITADGNTLSSNSTYYDDGNGKYKVTPSLTAAPYKFTATEAAEYKVTFVIKTAAQTNYTWASSLNGQDKEITFTVEKKTLTITLTPPTAANNSWSFPMGTTGDITASALTGVENSDPVTFDVSYYNKPSTAGAAIPAPTIEQTDKAYTDIALDVSNFSSTGDYVVWIRLNDDSNGNDINRNYKFAGQDTNTTPATENVHVQLVQVGSGSVNVSGIKWGYKEGTAGVLTQITSSTNIEYKKVSGTAQNYIVEIDPATMPSYLEVDTSYGLNGFTLGYNENDKTDANTYTAVVRLKIASGNTDYKFESTGSNGYTYIDDTHAELTYQWTIAQKELDFTNAEWQFSIDAINDTDANATWKKYDTTVQGGQPEHQSTPVWVRISEAYLSSLGLTSGAAGDVSFAYGSSNKNNPTSAAGTSVTTNVFVTILNSNYKNPASGNTYTFTWATTKKQINISNWNGTRGISGSDGAGGTKGFDFPAINVSNNDGNDYSTMVEYVYTYTLPNGVVKTNVTESEMIQDIYPIADMSNQISGIVTVRVKSAFAGQYDLNAGGSSLTAPFTCGDSKIMLDMGFGGTHTTYGDGGDFSLTASANGIDMLSTLGAYIEVTLTDKDGQVKVFTADNATAQDVLDFLANAGAYKFEFTLTNPAFSSSYGFTSSQLNYVVARKEIVVPQVIKALTFNGNDVIFTDHLDNQYTANSSMIDVTGDTQCRNVSQGNAYSVTLKLNDENYCWVLPASSQTPTKGLAKITLVDDTVETNVSIPATDPTRAVYSWNVAPLAVDTSKSWKDGKLTLPAELQNLVNSGDVTIKYNYYNDAGELLGDSESGFEPQGGVSYRIEAVLEGQDADGGNVVFVSSDGSISGKTSDRVVYTAPKSGMAKFKDTLTKEVAGLPLWAWIVIGVAALILLIILICIIVAAAKKKKKKEEEKAAKAEKEEAKAAAAAAAAAPMLAMSASMADEKAKLEAERAKMEAELAKAKMEAEAEAAKAKAQAELDLQRAKTEAEIARMRAEAQHASQPAPVQQPVQQPAPQPQYQQQPQPQYMPQPQPQYMPMPMPQPQYMMPQQQSSGSLSRLEEEFKAMRAEQRSDTKLENEMLKLRLDMSRGMSNQYGYIQNNQLPAGQQSNVSNGDVNLFAEKLGILMASMMRNMGVKAMPVPEKIEPQVIEAESQSGAVNTPTMYPPDAVITTTTTVDTTNRGKSINGSDRGEDPIFDIDGFYDKFDESK